MTTPDYIAYIYEDEAGGFAMTSPSDVARKLNRQKVAERMKMMRLDTAITDRLELLATTSYKLVRRSELTFEVLSKHGWSQAEFDGAVPMRSLTCRALIDILPSWVVEQMASDEEIVAASRIALLYHSLNRPEEAKRSDDFYRRICFSVPETTKSWTNAGDATISHEIRGRLRAALAAEAAFSTSMPKPKPVTVESLAEAEVVSTTVAPTTAVPTTKGSSMTTETTAVVAPVETPAVVATATPVPNDATVVGEVKVAAPAVEPPAVNNVFSQAERVFAKLGTPADASMSEVAATVMERTYGVKPSDLMAAVAPMRKVMGDLVKDANDLRSKLTALQAAPMPVAAAAPGPVAGAGKLPNGSMKLVNAADIFLIKGKRVKLYESIQVPFFEWDGKHPDVPEVDNEYMFEPVALRIALMALINNEPMWLFGPHGAGKTSLIEQMAARLNYPHIRISFDKRIERADLIGKDKLVTGDSGTTESVFEPGALTRALSMPCILVLDEKDHASDSNLYFLQPVLEGRGMRINEDGGRWLHPNSMLRIFSTNNTNGQGDSTGCYPNARPMSMAMLDRYRRWYQLGYLKPAQEQAMIEARIPTLPKAKAAEIIGFATEIRTAFTKGEILKTISPRGLLSIGMAYTQLISDLSDAEAMRVAVECSFVSGVNADSQQRVRELAERTLKIK